MSLFTRPTVVIFAKAPIPGTVKTRLAKTIGEEAALSLYETLLRRTIETASNPRWDTVIAATPDEATKDACYWPSGTPRIPQGEGDLGSRMLRLLEHAKPNAPVLVVGSDIPGLSGWQIETAFASLAASPLVFGPAEDGGFYLVGAADQPPPAIFRNVEWSTETTLRQVLDNVPAGSAGLIDRLEDLDDAESLERHRKAGRL
ncbi:TIGR04282 family arsenosugar biosynthesis glycosyltransferase [Fulvimarina sp. MAC3]|uniref:TIGR04282 family arsenosugar biosynthesis glycosyltransferase n=1 Tax=Fulvimarina sp. MAC3 TaxID=3148887 RepID=UPI0031FD1950